MKNCLICSNEINKENNNCNNINIAIKEPIYDVFNERNIFDENGYVGRGEVNSLQQNEYFRFLYIIKHLVKNDYKVETNHCLYVTTLHNDDNTFSICFNSKYVIIKISLQYKGYRQFFVTYDESLTIVSFLKLFLNSDMEQCVMIGGSFNPITNAHYQIAQEIILNVPKSYVVFVPTCDYYIKSFKKYALDDILWEWDRYRLLVETTLWDINIIVDNIEILEKREKTKTYRTLFNLNEKYSPDIMSFIIGSDNLSFLPKWWCAKDLLEKFQCIVVSRNVFDIKKEIDKYKFFENKIDCFNFLSYENKYPTLSSTLVRNLMREGKIEEIKKLIPLRAYYSLMGIIDKIKLNNIKNEKQEFLKLFLQNMKG